MFWAWFLLLLATLFGIVTIPLMFLGNPLFFVTLVLAVMLAIGCEVLVQRA